MQLNDIFNNLRAVVQSNTSFQRKKTNYFPPPNSTPHQSEYFKKNLLFPVLFFLAEEANNFSMKPQ